MCNFRETAATRCIDSWTEEKKCEVAAREASIAELSNHLYTIQTEHLQLKQKQQVLVSENAAQQKQLLARQEEVKDLREKKASYEKVNSAWTQLSLINESQSLSDLEKDRVELEARESATKKQILALEKQRSQICDEHLLLKANLARLEGDIEQLGATLETSKEKRRTESEALEAIVQRNEETRFQHQEALDFNLQRLATVREQRQKLVSDLNKRKQDVTLLGNAIAWIRWRYIERREKLLKKLKQRSRELEVQLTQRSIEMDDLDADRSLQQAVDIAKHDLEQALDKIRCHIQDRCELENQEQKLKEELSRNEQAQLEGQEALENGRKTLAQLNQEQDVAADERKEIQKCITLLQKEVDQLSTPNCSPCLMSL